MKQNDVVRVSVSGLGYGGEGIARIDNFVLFVPRALPGDILDVRINSLKKRYGSADIVTILEPSAHRRDPLCDGFLAGCGGCQWLNLDYAEQCKQKASIVEESFRRIGKIDVAVDAVAGAEHPFGCRNTFSLSRDVTGTLGLCIEKSADVLDLADCRMESASNLNAYRSIKELALPEGISHINLRSGTDGEVSLCFYAKPANETILRELITPLLAEKTIAGAAVKTGMNLLHLCGKRAVSAEIGGYSYSIPTDVFFQTNYPQAGKLLTSVRRAIEPGTDDTILDLYCGLGFFTLACATAGCQVVGVEVHPGAVKAADEMAKIGDLDLSFVQSSVGKYLRELRDAKGRFSKIILDPPRAGCGEGVARGIAVLEPQRIVYVSCAPDTLARDCAIFSECGYQIAECTAIDMFPQTYHVEIVATLTRKAAI